MTKEISSSNEGASVSAEALATAVVTVLTRDHVLGAGKAATHHRIVPVEVPEWGGTMYVRTLPARDRDAFESSMFIGEGKKRRRNWDNLRARFVVLVACDKDGNRIFTDEDAPDLGEENASAVDRLFDKGQEINGMKEKAEEEAAKS